MTQQAATTHKPPRNVAVDTYRGLVMLLMMGEVLRFAAAARFHPGSTVWHWLAFNQTHVEWTGMSLHDMIQPSFTFLAGVALPYSLRSRLKRGETFSRMLAHTILRSLILILLGIALRPWHAITFEDTLTQIGLGYTFAFLLAFTRTRITWLALALILTGYWLAWATYPLPPLHFDYAAVGVPPDWHNNLIGGFAAHWNKNANLGHAFDRWFLNLFPRTKPFQYNSGGYLTLSFIPTLCTMLLGLIAGRWFTERKDGKPPLKILASAGTAIALLGLALHLARICPIVKRIWTPSWVLWSGGLSMLTLAALSYLIDVRNNRKLAYPFVVVGMNSIAAYLVSELLSGPIRRVFESVATHAFTVNGSSAAIVAVGLATLVVEWLLLFVMFRRKLFLRI